MVSPAGIIFLSACSISGGTPRVGLALRKVPTVRMSLHGAPSRREFSTAFGTAALGTAFLSASSPVAAKVGPVDTTAFADFAVVWSQHGTPDAGKWYKDVYSPFVSVPSADLPEVFKPVVQNIAYKSAVDGKKVAVASIVPKDKLTPLKSFYDVDKNPMFVQGQKDGWLQKPFTTDYLEDIKIRGTFPKDVTPGTGLVHIQHGTKDYSSCTKLFASDEVGAFCDNIGALYCAGTKHANGKVVDVWIWIPGGTDLNARFDKTESAIAEFGKTIDEKLVSTPLTLERWVAF